MEDKYYNKICEILTQRQKEEAKILIEKLKYKDFESLIHIWEKSSSLLRWNNIKKELHINYYINSPHILNILIIGLQYIVDQKTHKSTYLSHILEDI